MDVERFHEGGVMLIKANRALIRGVLCSQTDPGPFLLPRRTILSRQILGGILMKGFKANRNMKVYGMSGHNYKSTPTIMLKGLWLAELGFDIGDYISVSCENGKLIITSDVERAAAADAEKAFMDKGMADLKKRFQVEKKKLRAQFVAEGSAEYGSGKEAADV